MKKTFSVLFYSVSLIASLLACKKEDTNTSNPPPSSGNSGTDTTSTNSFYVVKTTGISSVGAIIDTANSIYLADLSNGINTTARLMAGSDVQLQMVNADKEPTVEKSGSAIRAYYPNVKQGGASTTYTVTDADTAGNLFFRLTGFDYGKFNFHQLNLVMCNDSLLSSGTIGFLYRNDSLPTAPAVVNNAFLKKLFAAKLSKVKILVEGIRIL